MIIYNMALKISTALVLLLHLFLVLFLGSFTMSHALVLSNNLLAGPPAPDFPTTADIMEDSYANNQRHCEEALGPCPAHKHERKLMEFDSFRIGFEVGYVVSAAAVFMAFSFYWLEVEKVMKIMLLYKLQNMLRTKEAANQLTLKPNNEIPGLERLVNRISLEELCRATYNFSMDNVIGMGKTGIMYKVTLQNGWPLAVKRMNSSPQFESRFLSELLALARVKHHSIVPLFGFCTERNQMILVYKYMSNGSLHDWLHPVDGEPKILEWPLRLKIIIGIVRGLSWLHHNCDFRVVHGDISSKSILLDHHFEPKISNFGKTIISNHGGAMFKYANDGDSGFLVNSGGWESDFVKEDVFKFGIVLLELLTLKEALINAGLASRFILDDAIIDESLHGQGYDDEIMEVLRIATECVQPFPNERPTMLEVHERVSSLGERYGIITPCDSEYCCNQDITPNTGDEILPAEDH